MSTKGETFSLIHVIWSSSMCSQTPKRWSNQHNYPDGPYLTWTANLRCALRKQTSSCSAAFQPFCAFPELKQAEPERSRGGAAVGGGVGGDVSSSRVFVDFPKPPWGYRFHLPSPSLELRGFANTAHPLSTAWLQQHWPRSLDRPRFIELQRNTNACEGNKTACKKAKIKHDRFVVSISEYTSYA